jgi:hypothetical protein
MRAWLIIVGVFAWVIAAPKAARATPSAGPPVRLMLHDCPQISEVEVERVLAAELGSESAPNDDADPTFIVVTCAERRVLIEVTDVVSRKTLQRKFDLGRSTPRARPRLLAIAAAELVLASWAEIALRPRLRVEPEGPAPSASRARAAAARARTAASTPDVRDATMTADDDPEVEAEARARRSWWLTLQVPERRHFRVVPLVSTRSFIDHGGRLWGGGLRIGEEPLAYASWALDTLFESGTLENPSSSYKVDTWTLGALMYLHHRLGLVALRAGAGLRGGFVASRVASGEATRSAIPWGWPMLALNVTVGDHAQVELSAEASYVALPVTATTLGVSVRGLWLALQLGIGISP